MRFHHDIAIAPNKDIYVLDRKNVPAAEFSYSFTTEQVLENVKETDKMRSQITLSNSTVLVARIEFEMDDVAALVISGCGKRDLLAAYSLNNLINCLSAVLSRATRTA